MQKLTLLLLVQNLDGKRQRKPFICSKCGKKFLGRIALEEHSCSGVHKGKKSEKCTVVEKPLHTVVEKPGVHDGKIPEKCTVIEKPLVHKCGKCEKTFKILSDLNDHACQKNPFYVEAKDTKGKVNTNYISRISVTLC